MTNAVVNKPSALEPDTVRARHRLTVALLAACIFTTLLGCAARADVPSQSSRPVTLRSAAASRGVTVGAAVSSRQLGDPSLVEILQSEFSQLEPENEMKFALIHPRASTDPQPYDFN